MSDYLAIGRLAQNNEAGRTFSAAIDSFDITETFAAVLDLVTIAAAGPSESAPRPDQSTDATASESVADTDSTSDDSESDTHSDDVQPVDSAAETSARADIEIDTEIPQHQDNEKLISPDSSNQTAEIVEPDADVEGGQEPVVSAGPHVQRPKGTADETVNDNDAKPTGAGREQPAEGVSTDGDPIVRRSSQPKQAGPVEVAAAKPSVQLNQPKSSAGTADVVERTHTDQPLTAESAQATEVVEPRRRRKKHHRGSTEPKPRDLAAQANRASSASVPNARPQSSQAGSLPLPPADVPSPNGSENAVQVTIPQAVSAAAAQPVMVRGAVASQGTTGSAVQPAASVGSAKADPSVKANPTKTQTPESAKLDLADRARLLQRVARAFQQLGTDGGSLKIRLHPPRLGSVGIEVGVSGRKMNARIVTESEAASQVLRDSVPELRNRLAEQGFQIESIEITSDDFRGAGQGRGGQQEHSFEHSFGLPTETAPASENVSDTDAPPPSSDSLVSNSGIDLVA